MDKPHSQKSHSGLLRQTSYYKASKVRHLGIQSHHWQKQPLYPPKEMKLEYPLTSFFSFIFILIFSKSSSRQSGD